MRSLFSVVSKVYGLVQVYTGLINNTSTCGALRFGVIVAMLVFSCQMSFASWGDDTNTNLIAKSDWSEPVSLVNDQLHRHLIRGRLLIVKGMEPAYGGPSTKGAMTFVELHNITGAYGDAIDVYFDVMNLNCQLSEATGKEVPAPTGGPWGGRGPFAPVWVKLPYNSTIRLFINGGRMNPLSVYPGGEPWCYWSIPSSDTNTYYLIGTLSLSTHTNMSLNPVFRERDYKEKRTATLVFPKMLILPSEISGVEEMIERLPSRPELTMQEAILTAEQYIKAHDINISRHYLSKTHIVHASSWMEGIHWVITWSLKVPSAGGQIFVIVGNDTSVKIVGGL